MLSVINGENKISPIPSPSKKEKKKGQGSRKVAKPKSLATGTSTFKPGKKKPKQTLTTETPNVEADPIPLHVDIGQVHGSQLPLVHPSEGGMSCYDSISFH